MPLFQGWNLFFAVLREQFAVVGRKEYDQRVRKSAKLRYWMASSAAQAAKLRLETCFKLGA